MLLGSIKKNSRHRLLDCFKIILVEIAENVNNWKKLCRFLFYSKFCWEKIQEWSEE